MRFREKFTTKGKKRETVVRRSHTLYPVGR